MKKINYCDRKIIIFSASLIVTFPLTLRYAFLKATENSVIFIVEKTERVITSSENNSKYLIFTKEETFENTDEFFYLKFNSSDVYGNLKPNHRYEAKVVGFRVPFLSWYRNIINAKEVS